jgi:hypothetical protein
MAQIMNFDNFGDELMRTIDGDGQIIMDTIVHGAESLGSDFTVLKTRDKAALVQLDVKDAWKPAGDAFNPQQAIAVRSRFATFKEADIDLEITLSQIKEVYQSYIGWIKLQGRTINEVSDNPFELFFLNHLIAKHFEFVRKKTAWGGVYNAAGAGAGALADGFLAMFTAGRGVGGDILPSHVFDGDVITAANAYAQFNGVANLVKNVNEDLLLEELNVYCSLTAYDYYRQNRRTLFPTHVGPADRPTVMDDYSNMKFVVDPGLVGKSHISIAPKRNMLFVCNEDPGQYRLNIVKDVKSWKLSIRASLGFDYASPDWEFLNDLV